MLNKVKENIKLAMKNKEDKKNILRLILAKAKDIAKNDGNREVSSSDVEQAILKQIKQNNETIEISLANQRDCSKEQKEVEILMAYLPKQKTKKEMEELVTKIVNSLPEDKRNQKGRGLVMKELAKYKNVLNMKEASKFVGTILS